MRNKKNEAFRAQLLGHILRSVLFAIILLCIGLGIGMWGYHKFEGMAWVDAFANASMILSGMGPFGPLKTTSGKIFAGFYALFSGLSFIVLMGVIFAPIFHHFFHKFHLDVSDK